MSNNHIIQKQVLEVEMENPTDAFQFRNRLGEVFQDFILPRLNNLFDELGTETKTYRIEKLQIDAGIIARQNWEQLLTDKIISEVRHAIQLNNPIWIKQDAEPGKSFQPATKQSLHINASSKQEPIFEKDNQQPDKITWSNDEFYEVFLTYLKTGNLSWYVQDKPNLQRGFEELILPKTALINRLSDYLKIATEKELLRLVFVLPVSVLIKLIKALLVEPLTPLIDDILSFTVIIKQAVAEPSLQLLCIKRAVYLPFFTWLRLGQHVTFQSFLASQFCKYIKEDHPFLVPDILASTSNTKHAQHTLIHKIFKTNYAEKLVPKVEHLQPKSVEQPGERFIVNAGLVMLHPFLPQLFKEVNLTADNVFLDDSSCMKAVLLTHFLATGITTAEDYELDIEKLLCGLQPGDPIICDIILLESDKKEALDLLAQIIQLWKQNGVQVNGTIEGLQQSFLQRPGKITSKQNDWKLQVQQLPYDVVLSSLPWSISMIKTAWMKGMLWVEWA